jgi:hypothetical protein
VRVFARACPHNSCAVLRVYCGSALLTAAPTATMPVRLYHAAAHAHLLHSSRSPITALHCRPNRQGKLAGEQSGVRLSHRCACAASFVLRCARPAALPFTATPTAICPRCAYHMPPAQSQVLGGWCPSTPVASPPPTSRPATQQVHSG